MSEVVWPGDARAGALLSDDALLAAMTAVENGWLRCLAKAGLAPATDSQLRPVSAQQLGPVDVGGNPVIPLVEVLRSSAPEEIKPWIHRGLTSQDVLDTALALCLRDTADHILLDVRRQVVRWRELAATHRSAVQPGRTLTQHAVPTTFGLTAANAMVAIIDAAEDLAVARRRLPVQVGGAAGTLAAVVAIGASAALSDQLAAELELAPSMPWHTNRRPLTRVADAMVACVDAWSKVANDVLVRTRPEVGELSERSGGPSSTMPHKQNPVLSILIKRAGLLAPHFAAALHTAAAASVDERPEGGWHAEWLPLRLIGRTAAVAASQAADLLEGLVVHEVRMAANAAAAADALLSEQQAVTGSTTSVNDYLGEASRVIDDALRRADEFLGVPS